MFNIQCSIYPQPLKGSNRSIYRRLSTRYASHISHSSFTKPHTLLATPAPKGENCSIYHRLSIRYASHISYSPFTKPHSLLTTSHSLFPIHRTPLATPHSLLVTSHSPTNQLPAGPRPPPELSTINPLRFPRQLQKHFIHRSSAILLLEHGW